MKHVLVVYCTKSGSVEDIAQAIASTLRGSLVHVDIAKAESAPSARPYDAVIVGSGVRVSQWHSAARKWLTAQAEILRQRPVAFFTVALTPANEPQKTDEVRAYTDSLISETGVKPVDIGVFAGWNVPEKFGFAERLILKALKAPRGDFRDFDAVSAWATSVGQKLLGERVGS